MSSFSVSCSFFSLNFISNGSRNIPDFFLSKIITRIVRRNTIKTNVAENNERTIAADLEAFVLKQNTESVTPNLSWNCIKVSLELCCIFLKYVKVGHWENLRKAILNAVIGKVYAQKAISKSPKNILRSLMIRIAINIARKNKVEAPNPHPDSVNEPAARLAAEGGAIKRNSVGCPSFFFFFRSGCPFLWACLS